MGSTYDCEGEWVKCDYEGEWVKCDYEGEWVVRMTARESG